MTDQPLTSIRRMHHIAEAHQIFHYHRAGTKLARRKKYGDLRGLDALARFLLERDGTPVERTLNASFSSLKIQLAGVLDPYLPAGSRKLVPGSHDELDLKRLLTEAEMAALLEEYGDELAEKERFGLDGVDAVRFHIAEKFGLELTTLESLSPTALRKYLEREMAGWTSKASRTRPKT